MPRFPVLVALAAALLVPLTPHVAAQGATPVSLPIRPGAADCTVTPRSRDEIRALLLAANPAATPIASPVPSAPPAGRPADPETVAAVTATAVQFFACYNALDLGAMLALYPDEIAREAAASALGPALDMGPGTPPPADLDRILDAIDNPVARLVGLPERYRATLLDVREVTVLDDGRVGAVVVRRFGDQPDRPPVGEYIVFQRVEGRWLMVGGGEETALGGDLPAAASPTP